MTCTKKKMHRYNSGCPFKVANLLLLASILLVPSVHALVQQDSVNVASWGGAYEEAQQLAIFTPLAYSSGVGVNVSQYNGSLSQFIQRAETEAWDVVDMSESTAIAACEQDLLLKLAHKNILIPSKSLSLKRDFSSGSFLPCSIAHNAFATVFAYDDRSFPGIKPVSVEDLFNTERFPGKRALERSPDSILEWALLAEGVPPSQIYDLLSTRRGLDIAFRKLDTIREHIVWHGVFMNIF